MAAAFPSSLYARISPYGFSAEPEYLVSIDRAGDGTKHTLYNGEGWASSFTLIVRTAAERTTLRDFYKARKGTAETFTYVSPDDLVARTVRFESFAGRKIGPTVWEYAITLSEG